MYKIILTAILSLIISGCGNSNSKPSYIPDISAPDTPKVTKSIDTKNKKALIELYGEPNAAIIVNGKYYNYKTLDENGYAKVVIYNIDKNSTIQLEDAYGNRSKPIYILDNVDTNPPIITLNGDNPLYIEKGEHFNDPGAVAIDDVDGNLTVTITGSVDNSKVGEYQLQYSAIDSSGNKALVIRVVYVQDNTSINHAPTYNNTLNDIDANDSTTLNIDISQAFSDPDGDTLSFSTSGLPNGLSIDSATGVISGTLKNDASTQSPYIIKVIASDTSSASVEGNFTINVFNPAPIANDDNVTLNEDSNITIDVLGNDSDSDGDNITIKSIKQLPTNGSAQIKDGKILYTPKEQYSGEDSFVYEIVDAQGAIGEAKVNLIITHINHAPTYNNILNDIDANDSTTLNIDISQAFSDPDGDTLSFSTSGLPNGLSIDSATGVISGTLKNDASTQSPYIIKVIASDTSSASVEGNFTINVFNPAPTFSNPIEDINSSDNESINFSIANAFSDPDGDTLKYYSNNIPDGVTIDINSGVISGKLAPNASLNSPYSVNLTVVDSDGGSVNGTFNWNIANHPIEANNINAETTTNRSIAIYPYSNDSDPDNNIDPSSVTIESNATNGTSFTDFNGTIIYIPNRDYNGTDTVSYKICDQGKPQYCDSATVNITVNSAEGSYKSQTNWGFQEFDVPNNTITLNPGDSIKSALERLADNGGGKILFNPGLYEADHLDLPSNIVLEGAGMEKTIIKFKSSQAGHLMEARDSKENIILKDMTLDCRNNIDYGCAEFNYGTHNVLVENIHVLGATRSNITAYNEDWSSAGHFTIRNVITHNTQKYHGISMRFIKGAIVENCLTYKDNGMGIDLSRVYHAEVVNNTVFDTGYGMKFPGGDYDYLHNNFIDEVWIEGGIKFNPISEDYNNEHFHLENNVLKHTKGGIIDWGDSAPEPHFAEFVSRNNSVTDDYNGKNMIRVKSGINLYDYGDNVKNRDGNDITDEFEHIYLRNKTEDPYETDGVGYKSWGDPE